MQGFKRYIYILSCLFCILTLSACSSDDFVAGSDIAIDEPRQEVDAHFQLQLDLSGTSNGDKRTKVTRTASTLPGIDPDENRITSITLFVVDANTSNEPIWGTAKHTVLPILSGTISGTTGSLEMGIKTTLGKKLIYVGANMSTAQITDFCTSGGKYTSSKNTYKGVIDEFVDLNGRGIVMFGQLKGESTPGTYDVPIFNITGSTDKDNPIETGVELNRVVSKVAFTYTADENLGEGYAQLAEEVTGGFIKAANIHFMLNNTSKSIDFVGGLDNTFSNFRMGDYLIHSTNVTSENPRLYSYRKTPIPDFMIYTPIGHVFDQDGTFFNTGSLDIPYNLDNSNPPKDNPYFYSDPIDKYKGTTNAGKHWHYNSSLYCLENTVTTAGLPDTPAEIIDMRHGINTKVVVAAKYTPHSIWYLDGTALEYYDPVAGTSATDIEAMITTLTGDGTFCAVRSVDGTGEVTYVYYTENAAKHVQELPSDNPNFVDESKIDRYDRGYGYYATFITQPKLDNPVEMANDENYNLRRNNYYILNATYFTPPGAVYPQDLYILVNSVSTKWSEGKTTNIIVD